MFLHIGGSRIVFTRDIIGIFNLKLRKSAVNKQFLESVPSTQFLNTADFDENKSFIVTDRDVLLSPIAPPTLARRREESRKR